MSMKDNAGGDAPIAKTHMPAATAAAQPLEEPPQNRVGSCGLRAVPCARFRPVMPTPTSCRFALPSSTAPTARSAATAGASPRTSRWAPSCTGTARCTGRVQEVRPTLWARSAATAGASLRALAPGA